MSTPFNLPAVRREPIGQALNQLPQFLLMLGRLQEDKKEREQRVREFDARQATQKRQESRQEVTDFQNLLMRMDDKTARAAYVRGVESDNPELNKLIVDILPALSISAENQREAFDLEKRTRDARLIKEIYTEFGVFSDEGRRQLQKIAPELAPFAAADTTIEGVLGLLAAPPEIKAEPRERKFFAPARVYGAYRRQEVEQPKIPEGARSVLTKEGGWVYTLDEKTWISAETGEPITSQ